MARRCAARIEQLSDSIWKNNKRSDTWFSGYRSFFILSAMLDRKILPVYNAKKVPVRQALLFRPQSGIDYSDLPPNVVTKYE